MSDIGFRPLHDQEIEQYRGLPQVAIAAEVTELVCRATDKGTRKLSLYACRHAKFALETPLSISTSGRDATHIDRTAFSRRSPISRSMWRQSSKDDLGVTDLRRVS